MGGRPGDIFEIFQNGHIFLKILFFKNIKKKKAPQAEWRISVVGRELAGPAPPVRGRGSYISFGRFFLTV